MKWKWKQHEERSFLALKVALATAPILRLPNFDHQFVVTTDASDVAIGEILEKDVGMGLQPIALQVENCSRLKCDTQPMSASYWE